MQLGIGDGIKLLPLLLPVAHVPIPVAPLALSLFLHRPSLGSPCWLCAKRPREPCVMNGFPLQARSVGVWHKIQIIFGMNTQKYIGQNVFILNGIQNRQNIQLNLSLVHRQCGRLPSLLDVRQNEFLLPVMLWPAALCRKLSDVCESPLFTFCPSFHDWLRWMIALLWGVPSCSSVTPKLTSKDTLQQFLFPPVHCHAGFSLPWLKIMCLKLTEFGCCSPWK